MAFSCVALGFHLTFPESVLNMSSMLGKLFQIFFLISHFFCVFLFLFCETDGHTYAIRRKCPPRECRQSDSYSSRGTKTCCYGAHRKPEGVCGGVHALTEGHIRRAFCTATAVQTQTATWSSIGCSERTFPEKAQPGGGHDHPSQRSPQ